MTEVLVSDSNLTSIANKIREHTKSNLLYKVSEMPEGIDNVHASGKRASFDDYLQNGNVTNAQYMFAGPCWTDETFKPTTSLLKIRGAIGMFHSTGIVNLTKCLNDLGIIIDFSNVSSIQYAFAYSKLEYIPELNLMSAYTLQQMCEGASNLKRIELLKLKSDGTQIFERAFRDCTSLTDLIVEGVIGEDIDFSSCPLSYESSKSVLRALSTTTFGKVAKFNKAAKEATWDVVEWADETTIQRSNWNIVLV